MLCMARRLLDWTDWPTSNGLRSTAAVIRSNSDLLGRHMVGNIVEHKKTLVAKKPQLVVFDAMAVDGSKRRTATATGYIAEHFQGRTHSANHNFKFDILLGFRPAEHAISIAPRGFELRGVPLFGFRRVGWSIVDYDAVRRGDGLSVDVTVWVNHKNAWSLGLLYNCTALSEPATEN